MLWEMQQRGEAMYPTGIPNSQDYCKTLLEAIGGKYVNTSITTESWKLWLSLYPFHFLCCKLAARRILFWFYLPTHCSPFSTWFWCCPTFQNTLLEKKGTMYYFAIFKARILNPFAPEPPVTARADPGTFYPLWRHQF